MVSMIYTMVLIVSTSAYDAYQKENYEEALRGWIDERAKYPEDTDILAHIGNAHYKMGAWHEAEKAYSAALAATEDNQRKAQLHYDLGNCAYRSGRLDEAIKQYQMALQFDSKDEDSKYNLEFVRKEMQRRKDEMKKQTEKQQEDKQKQEPENQQENKAKEEKQKTEQQQGEQSSQKQSEAQQQEPDKKEGKEQAAEQQKTAAEKEGKLDPAQEQAAKGRMRREDAERYLMMIEDEKPKNRAKGSPQRNRSGKDW